MTEQAQGTLPAVLAEVTACTRNRWQSWAGGFQSQPACPGLLYSGLQQKAFHHLMMRLPVNNMLENITIVNALQGLPACNAHQMMPARASSWSSAAGATRSTHFLGSHALKTSNVSSTTSLYSSRGPHQNGLWAADPHLSVEGHIASG